MAPLTDEILGGNEDPTEDTMRSWVITGGSEAVELALRNYGYDGDGIATSIGVYVSDEGNIIGTQIFINGCKEVGRLMASILWDKPLNKEDYAKVESVDLSLANIRGRMVSDWISGDKLDWCLKVMNPETKKYRVIGNLDEDGLKAKGASKLSFRVHVSLRKGPKLGIKLGCVPADRITDMVGHGPKTFP